MISNSDQFLKMRIINRIMSVRWTVWTVVFVTFFAAGNTDKASSSNDSSTASTVSTPVTLTVSQEDGITIHPPTGSPAFSKLASVTTISDGTLSIVSSVTTPPLPIPSLSIPTFTTDTDTSSTTGTTRNETDVTASPDHSDGVGGTTQITVTYTASNDTDEGQTSLMMSEPSVSVSTQEPTSAGTNSSVAMKVTVPSTDSSGATTQSTHTKIENTMTLTKEQITEVHMASTPGDTHEAHASNTSAKIAAGILIPLFIIVGCFIGYIVYKRRKAKDAGGYLTLDEFGGTEGLNNPNYDLEL